MSGGRHWTTSEIAAWLRVSTGRVRALVRDGLLPARRLCPRGRLLFDPAEVERALADGARLGQATAAAPAGPAPVPAA